MSGMAGDIQTSPPSIAAGAVSGNLINLTLSGVLTLPRTDISGTPGNGTVNTMRGRCAIAAAASQVVITSSIITANSTVMAIINGAAADATLTSISRITVAANTLTIIGNAAATGNVVIDFVVFP